MKLLLDTHAYLWWLDNPQKISRKGREAIENINNTVFVSAAVAWEIAIKQSIGKLKAPANIMEYLEQEKFIELPITIAHTEMLGKLEGIHRDPFDRILLAQAKVDNLVFITRDQINLAYSNIKMIKA